MADDEQFSLCWNNFNTNLSAGFHESLCRGDLVDVTLAAEGQLVKAHRLVLSVCSPYFRKMFTQMPANQHAFVFLKDVSHSALKDLIQFMYCGEVNVKQEALPAFISTAEALQIKGLTDSDPPSSQSPPEPSTPTQQTQQIASPRMSQQRQRTSTSRSYKIETVDDTVDDKTPSTQIVIQTTSAAPPIATIVHHQQPQQLQHHHQSQQTQIQTVSSVASSAVVTANTGTLVQSSSKRSAQRSSVGSSVPHAKRTKSTIDPLDTTETATTTANTQIQPQQITVQSAIVTTDNSKIQQPRQQQTSAETEYIDLPSIELPTKSEPDYAEDAGEVVTGDQDTSYVEDDAYGDMRYDESYFTENEDGAPAVSAANASGTVAASTSKAVTKQQTSQSFSDSSYADPSDQGGNSEAQGKRARLRLTNNLTTNVKLARSTKLKTTENLSKSLDMAKRPRKACNMPAPQQVKLKVDTNNPENVVKQADDQHKLVVVSKPRIRGKCVTCLMSGKQDLDRIVTYCPACPNGSWMCETCFDELHA